MIGVVTIGQAPRNDITASMFEERTVGRILQFGALDGLDRPAIESLQPGPDDAILVSRLVDGTEVELGKASVTPLVQLAITRALEAGASVICVLCTGEFAGLTATVPIIFPDQVVGNVVDSLLPKGRLGVFMPHEGQRSAMVGKWAREGREVVTVAVSPYTASDELSSQARRLCEENIDLIVMDCMGFTREMEQAVRTAACDVPVVLSNGIVGAVIAEAWGLRSSSENAVSV